MAHLALASNIGGKAVPIFTHGAHTQLFHSAAATVGEKVELFLRFVDARNFVHEIANLSMDGLYRFGVSDSGGRSARGWGDNRHFAGDSHVTSLFRLRSARCRLRLWTTRRVISEAS